jgi:uncharacterized protein YfaS (alpha-2-macroglobulin family)
MNFLLRDGIIAKSLEIRRAIFFMPNYNQGEFTFSYMTYAQLPGKYNVPSSVASLMYYPEVRGTSKEKKLVIVE